MISTKSAPLPGDFLVGFLQNKTGRHTFRRTGIEWNMNMERKKDGML